MKQMSITFRKAQWDDEQYCPEIRYYCHVRSEFDVTELSWEDIRALRTAEGSARVFFQHELWLFADFDWKVYHTDEMISWMRDYRRGWNERLPPEEMVRAELAKRPHRSNKVERQYALDPKKHRLQRRRTNSADPRLTHIVRTDADGNNESNWRRHGQRLKHFWGN